MISGWLTFLLFCIATLIIILTKKKSILHCIISYAAMIMCLIHTIFTYYSISFSPGYISLMAAIMIILSGIAMRHFPRLLGKKYKAMKAVHAIISTTFAVALAIHIIEFIIF